MAANRLDPARTASATGRSAPFRVHEKKKESSRQRNSLPDSLPSGFLFERRSAASTADRPLFGQMIHVYLSRRVTSICHSYSYTLILARQVCSRENTKSRVAELLHSPSDLRKGPIRKRPIRTSVKYAQTRFRKGVRFKVRKCVTRHERKQRPITIAWASMGRSDRCDAAMD